MSESSRSARGAGPSHRGVEIGVAVGMATFAMIVIVGSVQVGIGWGAEGPKAGFFPFYVALLILVSSIVNGIQIFAEPSDGKLFTDWGQLRQVMSVVVPTAIYVGLVPWIGIYVASIVLIAFFMKWLGRYGWLMVAAVSIGVVASTFLVFEKWFLVPLPKGPIEDLFGL